MKTIKLLSILLLVAPCLSAQTYQLGADANVSQPTGMMSQTMDNALGLTLSGSKVFDAPFSAGLELNFGNYGYQTSRQEYTFDDGSVTETDVNVSNNIFSMYLTGKHFLRNNKNVNPYLSAKAGWSWFTTNLTIEDPQDQYSCHPLQSEILARDNTYTFSGGLGLLLDFNAFFKNSSKGRFYFDLNIHGTYGGIVKYMNVDTDGHQQAPDQDVTARFINTQTQVIHEHHVGYLYSNVLKMIEYRVGLIYRIAAPQD
jgi:hypothetical protein